MKTYRVLTLTLLLAVAGSMLADNLLVENTSLAPGETRQVAITLKTPDKTYAAFQFDLLLPKGLSIAKNGNKLMASLDKDRKDDHRLTISLKSEGKYRLMAYSDSNSEFLGTDGPLVYVTLQADAGAAVGAKTVPSPRRCLPNLAARLTSGTTSPSPSTSPFRCYEAM